MRLVRLKTAAWLSLQVKPELDALKSQAVLLAVSGGSDSMALLWHVIEMGFEQIHVVTIDHGLRKEAQDEAEFVKSVCRAHHIDHKTIAVGVKRNGNLQSNARDVRYKAMIEHCKAHEINHVFLGHTADDQAETFMLRAFRGSGIDGLAGIAEKREERSITFWRPLLSERRDALRAKLLENNWSWIEDPSNEDERFDRVKMRKLLTAAEDVGFSPDGLLQTVSNMERIKSAFDPIVQEFRANHISSLPLDVEDQMDPQAFAQLPKAIATKVLGDLCKKFGRGEYLPRRDGIDRLYDMIMSTQDGGMTIALTDFHWSKNRIRICAEYEGLLSSSSKQNWHRWRLSESTDYTIRAIGERASQHAHWREFGISYRAAKTLPALFEGKKCIYVHGELSKNSANLNFELSAHTAFTKL